MKKCLHSMRLSGVRLWHSPAGCWDNYWESLAFPRVCSLFCPRKASLMSWVLCSFVQTLHVWNSIGFLLICYFQGLFMIYKFFFVCLFVICLLKRGIDSFLFKSESMWRFGTIMSSYLQRLLLGKWKKSVHRQIRLPTEKLSKNFLLNQSQTGSVGAGTLSYFLCCFQFYPNSMRNL